MRPWLSKRVQHWKQDEICIQRQSATAKRSQSGADLFTRITCNHSGNFFSSTCSGCTGRGPSHANMGIPAFNLRNEYWKFWKVGICFLYTSLFGSSAQQFRGREWVPRVVTFSWALPASNMLGRWSIDGVFTMRRVPREHQAGILVASSRIHRILRWFSPGYVW